MISLSKMNLLKQINKNYCKHLPLVHRPHLLTRPEQHCIRPPSYTITGLTIPGHAALDNQGPTMYQAHRLYSTERPNSLPGHRYLLYKRPNNTPGHTVLY